jgi:hypothetical protein
MTIRHYIDKLPTEIRNKVYEYAKNPELSVSGRICDLDSDFDKDINVPEKFRPALAISCCFDFEKTTEGWEYWSNVKKQIG